MCKSKLNLKIKKKSYNWYLIKIKINFIALGWCLGHLWAALSYMQLKTTISTSGKDDIQSQLPNWPECDLITAKFTIYDPELEHRRSTRSKNFSVQICTSQLYNKKVYCFNEAVFNKNADVMKNMNKNNKKYCNVHVMIQTCT